MKMKKIVVMSDSHGYHQMINRVKELEPDGDYYVHCGDSEAETYMMQDWLCVKGNNDWYSDFPNQIKFKVEDLNFLVAHGHRFGYMDRETSMIYTLQEANLPKATLPSVSPLMCMALAFHRPAPMNTLL